MPKPSSDFPLFLHSTGQWAKKVRGVFYYFGKDRTAALKLWKEQKESILSGRKKRSGRSPDGITVKDLVDKFLSAKELMKDGGELSPVSFHHYFVTCRKFRVFVGSGRLVEDLGADDSFHIAK